VAGTSTKSISDPSSSARWAYPTSIVIPAGAPRAAGRRRSGQRPEQRRLAVVDVTRGPDDDGHVSVEGRPNGRRELAVPGWVDGPQVEHHPSRLDPPDHRRLAGPELVDRAPGSSLDR
jgi:hypothetical protein